MNEDFTTEAPSTQRKDEHGPGIFWLILLLIVLNMVGLVYNKYEESEFELTLANSKVEKKISRKGAESQRGDGTNVESNLQIAYDKNGYGYISIKDEGQTIQYDQIGVNDMPPLPDFIEVVCDGNGHFGWKSKYVDFVVKSDWDVRSMEYVAFTSKQQALAHYWRIVELGKTNKQLRAEVEWKPCQ